MPADPAVSVNRCAERGDARPPLLRGSRRPVPVVTQASPCDGREPQRPRTVGRDDERHAVADGSRAACGRRGRHTTRPSWSTWSSRSRRSSSGTNSWKRSTRALSGCDSPRIVESRSPPVPSPQRKRPPDEVVEGEDVAGEDVGVAEVRRRDEGAEPDRRRHPGGRGQRRHRGEPRAVREPAPHEVVVDPRVAEAHLLDGPPPWAGLAPGEVGQDRDPVSHVGSALSSWSGKSGRYAVRSARVPLTRRRPAPAASAAPS